MRHKCTEYKWINIILFKYNAYITYSKEDKGQTTAKNEREVAWGNTAKGYSN